MSRVGKMPILIPAGVEANVSSEGIIIKGPLGVLSHSLSDLVKVQNREGALHFSVANNSREANARFGMSRALVNNMIIGVTKGFIKKLSLVGVGFRAQMQGNELNLSLGFSHPVVYRMPDGIMCETPTQTEILVKGIDKQRVGQVAAEVRSYREPEPYKGKGIRYSDEVVSLKETKKK